MTDDEKYFAFVGPLAIFTEEFLIDYLEHVLPEKEWTSSNIAEGFEELFDSLSTTIQSDIMFFPSSVLLHTLEKSGWCIGIHQLEYSENLSPKALRMILFELLKTLDLVKDQPEDFDSVVYTVNIVNLEEL